MQVLKEEIRGRILESAEERFYQNGYRHTSMRSIAEDVGISVSNLYKYFKNKEAIFSAVVGKANRILLEKFEELFEGEHPNHTDIGIQETTLSILDVILKSRKAFIILMCRAEGTKYEGFRKKITAMFVAHMKRESQGEGFEDDFILYVIAGNFFEGMMRIQQSERSVQDIISNFKRLMKYHLAGMREFK